MDSLNSPCNNPIMEKSTIPSLVALVLEELIARNMPYAHYAPMTKFHATTTPRITIKDYVHRIHKYSNASHACYIVAVIYLDRLIQSHPNLLITSQNIHRLFFSAILVAIKFMDDEYFDNALYGRMGGVSNEELNRLELEILGLLRFELHVPERVFKQYEEHIVGHYAKYLPESYKVTCRMTEDEADYSTDESTEMEQQYKIQEIDMRDGLIEEKNRLKGTYMEQISQI